MYCSQCGKQISEHGRFCHSCGAEVTPISNRSSKGADTHTTNQDTVPNIEKNFAQEKLIQGSLRQEILVRAHSATDFPLWLTNKNTKARPPIVSIFITEDSIIITSPPEKNTKKNIISDVALFGRLLGGPILGVIPHLIGDTLQEKIKNSEVEKASGKLLQASNVLWTNRNSCKHYECIDKGSFFGNRPHSYWCIESNFYLGSNNLNLLLIFGPQEKGGWAHFFGKAGINAHEYRNMEKNKLVSEIFPEFPFPKLSKEQVFFPDF